MCISYTSVACVSMCVQLFTHSHTQARRERKREIRKVLMLGRRRQVSYRIAHVEPRQTVGVHGSYLLSEEEKAAPQES